MGGESERDGPGEERDSGRLRTRFGHGQEPRCAAGSSDREVVGERRATLGGSATAGLGDPQYRQRRGVFDRSHGDLREWTRAGQPRTNLIDGLRDERRRGLAHPAARVVHHFVGFAAPRRQQRHCGILVERTDKGRDWLFGREVNHELIDGAVTIDFVQIDGQHIAVEAVDEPIRCGRGRGQLNTESIRSHAASINGILVEPFASGRTAGELTLRDC